MTLAVLLLALPSYAEDMEKFVVRDMRVQGLQRISEGTVFNYLPINIGDTVDTVRIREAIRALYGQGLFNDIEIRRDGETLVIVDPPDSVSDEQLVGAVVAQGFEAKVVR